MIDILSRVNHEKWFTDEPFMVTVVINGETRLTELFSRLRDRFSEFILVPDRKIQSSISRHLLAM